MSSLEEILGRYKAYIENGAPSTIRIPTKQFIRIMKDIDDAREMTELIETMTPRDRLLSKDFVILEVGLRRGSPLHKLWQRLHLKKYPENY